MASFCSNKNQGLPLAAFYLGRAPNQVVLFGFPLRGNGQLVLVLLHRLGTAYDAELPACVLACVPNPPFVALLYRPPARELLRVKGRVAAHGALLAARTRSGLWPGGKGGNNEKKKTEEL
jgi:hypothetical protein